MGRIAVACALVLAVAAAAPAGAAGVVRGPTRAQAWLAHLTVPTRVYRHPRPRRVVARLGTQAPWAGGPNQLLVLAARTDRLGRRWLRVRLTSRPNDAAGWLLADHAVLSRTRWRVELDLSARRMTVRHGGRVVRRFSAVVGKPSTPTPTGLFAIAEKVRQPSPGGFLGPWALHLSANSDVLDDYGGGPGRVAIHGRGGASLRDPLGSARSHGCIRIDNRQVRFLARVLVPGAPVRVTS
jgi:lipoprotein-anchoring transpeptidase ErfK/SrfK